MLQQTQHHHSGSSETETMRWMVTGFLGSRIGAGVELRVTMGVTVGTPWRMWRVILEGRDVDTGFVMVGGCSRCVGVCGSVWTWWLLYVPWWRTRMPDDVEVAIVG